jgi:hypothetical protein
MIRSLSIASAVMLAIIGSAAQARGPGGGFGASGFSPGHSFLAYGPVTGYPGASGYAPGRLTKSRGPVAVYPGASGYAPGKLKR